jgi:adenylylsulfate kinase
MFLDGQKYVIDQTRTFFAFILTNFIFYLHSIILVLGEIEMLEHSHEGWTRSLAKAISYRVLIIILDLSSIYLLTGKIDVAIEFMVVSNIYTSIAYYVHERIWDKK